MKLETLNIPEPIYKEFLDIKGELIKALGLDIKNPFVLKALISYWKGNSKEAIADDAQKAKVIKTAEEVAKL